MSKIWTTEKIVQLKDNLKSGLSVSDTARKMNTTYDAVNNAVRRYNLQGISSPVPTTPVANLNLSELNDENFEKLKKEAKLKWTIPSSSIKNTSKKGFKKYIIVGDIHVPEQDDLAMNAVFKLLKSEKFDGIINIGDFMDFSSISKYSKGKIKKLEGQRLKKDYIAGNAILDVFDKLLPKNAEKYFMTGNHEVRLNALIDEFPMLEGLFDFESCLYLKERGYKIYPHNEIVKFGRLNICHGIYCGANPAKSHATKLLSNILVGHLHSPELALIHSPAKEVSVVGYVNGCLCYDEQTEVLTEDGWVYFKDLGQGVKILGYNPTTKYAQYEYPVAYQQYQYNGIMHHYLSDRNDLLVTPDHKMLWKNSNGSVVATSSEELFNKRKNYGLIVSGNLTTHSEIDLNLVKLLGWIITEGSYDDATNRIIIYQKKEPHLTNIKTILNNLNLKYTIRLDRRNNVSALRLNAEDTRKILKFFDNENIKRIPRFLLNTNSFILNILWDTLIAGDGHVDRHGHKYYATIYKELADDVAELLHKIGKGSNIRYCTQNTTYKQNAHVYRISEIQADNVTITKKFKENYNGIVYDVTMPSGFLYVRRNGLISISGNCSMSPEYMMGKPSNWSQGIAILYLLPDGQFDVTLIRIVKHKFVYNDKIYDGNK